LNSIPERLVEIIEAFEWSEGREKLELLLDYAERLPPLPEYLQKNRAAMQQVQECMTPVYVYARIEDKKLFFYFDVPPESPTVRGFASLIAEGLNGLSAEQVLQVPNDFYLKMGLQHVLTSQRMGGMAAVLSHMKRLAMESLA
jgi:cysteine desulfuration protein SufE